jgi:hypothetical protein
MMVFLWFCVMMKTMAPSGEVVTNYCVSAMQDGLKALTMTREEYADELIDMRNAAAKARIAVPVRALRAA